MPNLLDLQTFSSEKGSLTVFERILKEDIKRVFYIYGVNDETRGGHRHKIARNALCCVNGSCEVYINDGNDEFTFLLESPQKCLLVEPNDWHQMRNFSKDAILLVISDQYFDKDDFITEPYPLFELEIVE